MTELTLQINKVIHAPIEKVFDAWLNSKMLSKFMIPMPGMPQPDVELDAREGGRFTIIMHVDDDKLPHTGMYVEIDRPNKLVFTWQSHRSVDDSQVTLNFTKIDDHKTNLLLTQVKFIDEDARSDHKAGWSNILDKLNDIMS
jgi:uncharacterized protein YndB with AHSA1/START domain